MTITQLKYIIAVNDYGGFAKAAEKCHVTQSTLSIQIKKLEEELSTNIFDRTKKPVQPTSLGEQVIQQAKISFGELERINEIIRVETENEQGEIRIGIIPTLSPYLVPLFSLCFSQSNPNIQLTIKEMLSEEIVYGLYNGHLDLGILVTPLNNPGLKSIPLFYEPFIAYISKEHDLFLKQQIEQNDLDLKEMWLLKEGHCLRGQVLNICEENAMQLNRMPIRFESGSLEALRRLVEQQNGYTLLPKLATLEFNEHQMSMTKTFAAPEPVREVSIVMNRQYMKRKYVESLKQSIIENIPTDLITQGDKKVINWALSTT